MEDTEKVWWKNERNEDKRRKMVSKAIQKIEKFEGNSREG